MKFLLLLLAMVIGCCQVAAPAPIPAKDVTTVSMYWQPTITFHADTSFDNKRKDTLLLAAEKIQEFTQYRATVEIKFDLDFASISNLSEHVNRGDNYLFDVEPDSSIAKTIDARHLGSVINAETSWYEDKHIAIVFIPARYVREHDLAIAMHELGHAIGFNDLPTYSDIMSGGLIRGSLPIYEFTDGDRRECRRIKLCD